MDTQTIAAYVAVIISVASFAFGIWQYIQSNKTDAENIELRKRQIDLHEQVLQEERENKLLQQQLNERQTGVFESINTAIQQGIQQGEQGSAEIDFEQFTAPLDRSLQALAERVTRLQRNVADYRRSTTQRFNNLGKDATESIMEQIEQRMPGIQMLIDSADQTTWAAIQKAVINIDFIKTIAQEVNVELGTAQAILADIRDIEQRIKSQYGMHTNDIQQLQADILALSDRLEALDFARMDVSLRHSIAKRLTAGD